MPFPTDATLHREMSRRAGKKGGTARARNLTAKQRSEIARMGAIATNRKRRLKKTESIAA